MSRFSASRALVADFGTAESPSWKCHRRMTCAGDTPSRSAMPVITGFDSVSPRPSGLQDWVTMPCAALYSRAAVRASGRVELDLVDRRRHPGLRDQPVQVRRLEVGDTDRPGLPRRQQRREGLPGVDVQVAGRQRPVDQQQVDVVQSESPQRRVEPADRPAVPLVRTVQLGGDEQVRPVDAARPGDVTDALADARSRCRTSRRCRPAGNRSRRRRRRSGQPGRRSAARYPTRSPAWRCRWPAG